MKISHELMNFLEKNRIEVYEKQGSIMQEFEEFLALKNIYLSYDSALFHETIKGRMDLCDDVLTFYKRAILPNEKISFLEDLLVIGYDKNKLVEMVVEVFTSGENPSNLWEYGDLLFSMKKYKYLSQYIEIIQNKSYGHARQMVVLLVGKSKKEEVIPILKDLLNDPDVYGHALDALTNFSGEDIETIMMQYVDYKVTWVRNTAKKYLKKNGKL